MLLLIKNDERLMKYTENISNRLNDLLEKTYDAEKGYKLAADEAKAPYVKDFLKDKEKQRLKRQRKTTSRLWLRIEI